MGEVRVSWGVTGHRSCARLGCSRRRVRGTTGSRQADLSALHRWRWRLTGALGQRLGKAPHAPVTVIWPADMVAGVSRGPPWARRRTRPTDVSAWTKEETLHLVATVFFEAPAVMWLLPRASGQRATASVPLPGVVFFANPDTMSHTLCVALPHLPRDSTPGTPSARFRAPASTPSNELVPPGRKHQHQIAPCRMTTRTGGASTAKKSSKARRSRGRTTGARPRTALHGNTWRVTLPPQRA